MRLSASAAMGARRLMHFVELAPRMGPARRQLDIAAGAKPLEAGIAVDLNDPFEPRQMSSGTLGATIRAVKVDRRRWISPAPGPLIAGIDPEPAGLGAAAAGIEHRDWGVIGEQRLRGEDMLGEPCLQRLQLPAGAADPVRQGRAVELDAVAGEDLALSVKWEMIAVFGDQDMREQRGTGEALGDRTLRDGRLMDGPAGAAAIAWPADADDPKPRRHMIEHLADRLANRMQFTAAAGAGLMLEIEPHLLAGQMGRQAWPLGPCSRRLDLRGRKLGFSPPDIGIEIFEAELQLVVIESFSASAKLAALQLLNDEPQPFDLRLRLGESGAFGRERPNYPLQRLHIVRQGGKIDIHEHEV